MAVGEEPYRFDELGRMQFERLCLALLEDALGVSTAEWRELRAGCAVLLANGVTVPDATLAGPTLAVIAWIRDPRGTATEVPQAVDEALGEWPAVEPGSLLVLTNATEPVDGLDATVLGPAELTALVSRSWPVRLALPSVLGIGAADGLAATGSTF